MIYSLVTTPVSDILLLVPTEKNINELKNIKMSDKDMESTVVVECRQPDLGLDCMI